MAAGTNFYNHLYWALLLAHAVHTTCSGLHPALVQVCTVCEVNQGTKHDPKLAWLGCLQGDIKQHMVRFSCNQGYKDWNFWLEVDASHPEVLMKVAVSLLEETDAISDFNSHLPSWTSEVAVTTYQSSWKL